MLYTNSRHVSQERVINDTKQHYIILGENNKQHKTKELRIFCNGKTELKRGQLSNCSIGNTRSGNPKIIKGNHNSHLLIDTNITHHFNEPLTFPPVNGHVNIMPLVYHTVGVDYAIATDKNKWIADNIPNYPKIIEQGSIYTPTGVNHSYLIEYNSDYIYEIRYSNDYVTYIFEEYFDQGSRLSESTFEQMVESLDDLLTCTYKPSIQQWIKQQLDTRLKQFGRIGKL